MGDPRQPHDDSVNRFLVQEIVSEDRATGPCPEPGLLAGFARSHLRDEERRDVEEHAAACTACRQIVSTLVEEARGEQPLRSPWPVRMTAVAAAAATVIALLLISREQGSPGTEVRLARAADTLAESHAGLFGGFQPLSRKERLAPRADLQRDTLAALYPADNILETRPTARWEPFEDAEGYTVGFYANDGSEIWRSEATGGTCAYPKDQPALAPGTDGFWELTCRGPFGEQRSHRSFTVASTEKRGQFEQAVRKIRAAAPEVAALLTAHYALRAGYSGEAERAAREYVRANPWDPVGRETLFQALERLGASDAARVLEERHDPE